jgi:tetratricopeptide (TPR) repeat protein
MYHNTVGPEIVKEPLDIMQTKSLPLIGREKELERMLAALHKAIDGQGQTVLVSGEPGQGITRLVNELIELAKTQGVLCLSSKCLFKEGADPYLPFTDALKAHLDKAKKDDLKEKPEASEDRYKGMLPMGLMGLSEEAVEKPQAEPESLIASRRRTSTGTLGTDFTKERERMFSFLVSVLSDLTVKQPVALFLDDLQWADGATLQLFTYIIRNSSDQRLLMIGAYRASETETKKGHPLKEVIQRVRREGRCTEVKLGALKKEHVELMIATMLGVHQVPKAFTERILKETGGNPLFVEELLKSLVQEGIIPEKSADLTKVDISKVKVPSSVAALLMRKLEGLDDTQKKVLENAAVVGEEFPLEVLGKLVDIDEMALIDLLEGLMGLQIVQEVPEEGGEIRYRFVHKQMRGVVYDQISGAKKRLLHKKVGTVLEALPPKEREKHLFALAHHLVMASELDKAIIYTIMAGERAERAFAAEDAIACYEDALSIIDKVPATKDTPKSKKDIVARIAELKFMTQNWSDALKYLKTLEKEATEQKDQMMLSEVHRRIGHIERMRGSWAKATAAYNKALEISESTGDELGIAEALQGLGPIQAMKADFDVARAYLEKSVDIAMAMKDTLNLGRTYIELGHVLRDQGSYEEALGTYTEGLMLLEKAGDPYTMTRGYLAIGDLCLRTKDWDKAIDFYGKAQAMAEKTKDAQMKAWALFKLGESYAHTNNFTKAEDLCGKALMSLARSDDKIGLAYVYASYGIVFKLKGDFGKAFVQFQQALNTAEDISMPIVAANINLEIGLMYKDKGDTETARRFFEKTKKIADKVEATAVSEQAQRLLDGLERYGATGGEVERFIDKNMKAMMKRTQRREEPKIEKK